ncbi:hypothetical protein Ddye_005425 [Dipteronia dyeriana]|uniref:Prp31 C-terminal domain-containing protein n=1 Tax=Dipteronia dyeriana TaxID=168575 RepID=A0AAD9XGL4_9ROSI|nr:hypothetical protein Ddye_005425 [Dipteronia dyeriana]
MDLSTLVNLKGHLLLWWLRSWLRPQQENHFQKQLMHVTVLALDSTKKKVLDFLEGEMEVRSVSSHTALSEGPCLQAVGCKINTRSTGGFHQGRSFGECWREDFYINIDNWQEPPPAKLLPDSEPKKKKRGSRRSGKMKERYAMTDMRKMANRMLFGVPEENYLGAGYGNGYGMLGHVCRYSY